jgi:large subunit ribosomal protein L14e
MIDVGRVCIKLAGRDAGKIAVVVEKIDDKFVLIDGNVRRRKCNISHLEPTEKEVSLKKGAKTEDVHKAMSAADLVVEGKKKVKRTEKVEKKTTTKKTTKKVTKK